MSRPSLEVADVFRAHGTEFLRSAGGRVSSAKLRVLRAVEACRTAKLGGHVEECRDCGHRGKIAYNSCRNRHCPKCQGESSAGWFEARRADLLPVEYFHVVFTLPEQIAAIALQNKREVYGMLFRSAAATLKEIAADPKHLGAEIGFFAVLHTWGQNLLHHPHVHCVVPGGGLSPDGRQWVSSKPGFFLPIRVLRRLFRGKMLAALQRAYDDGQLSFQGRLEHLGSRRAFCKLLALSRKTDWVVDSRPPFGGPEQVLKYLARYTHRVAISNGRLTRMEDGQVSFGWKDYAHGSRQRTMTLTAVEFIRRFLLHVLPKGFPRMRHYGFLANRSSKLERCRELLGCAEPEPAECPEGAGDGEPLESTEGMRRCPACGSAALVCQKLSRRELGVLEVAVEDSS